jgi:hypothetical protein
MKQFVCFVIVGLAFTTLQVAPVGAQEAGLAMEDESSMCDDVPCDPGVELPMCGDVPCDPGVELPMCGDVPCDPVIEAIEEDYRRLPLPEDMGKFFEYDKQYRANGALSQSSYDELSEAGYTKKRVDWVLTQIKKILQGRHGGD